MLKSHCLEIITDGCFMIEHQKALPPTFFLIFNERELFLKIQPPPSITLYFLLVSQYSSNNDTSIVLSTPKVIYLDIET